MKYRVITLLAIISLLSLSACMQDHPNPLDVKREVKVIASIDGAKSQSLKTRVTNNSWEAGDSIGLFMKKNGEVLTTSALALNAKYVLSDGTSTFSAVSESDRIYFPFQNENVDFIAYYPFKSSLIDFNYPVDVSDQSDLPKIDLMYSNDAKKINSTSENVKLTFFHQLSNIILNISIEGDTPEEDLSTLKAKITNVNTNASFSLVDNSLIIEAVPKSVSFNVSTDGKTAQAILLPSESIANSTLEFTTNTSSYSYSFDKTDIESLNKSTKYTLNVTLKPEQEQNIEVITSTIEDWADGGTKNITADEDKTKNPPEDDLEEEGDGSEGNPYNVNQIEENIGETNVWVQGYIVGHYSGHSRDSFIAGIEKSNHKDIAIASTSTETDSIMTSRIYLKNAPSNIRSNAYLEGNPNNITKKGVFYGNIEDLRGKACLANVRTAIIDGVRFK